MLASWASYGWQATRARTNARKVSTEARSAKVDGWQAHAKVDGTPRLPMYNSATQ